jgi:nucleoside-diphosphate-sugar epimerase
MLRVDGDGSERLDFTYIDDLVEGVLLVLQAPEAHNQIFNLTYGRSRSIAELLAIVQQFFPEARVEHVARDNLMPFRGTLSVRKAQALLDYAPKYPIEIGMARYIEWYLSLARKEQKSAKEAA